MKVSGFTFVKNAEKLFIPVRESILSVLPLVDEFIVLLGDSDPGDSTEAIVRSIHSDKIRIHHNRWNTESFPGTMVFAHQTDLAMDLCTGDWLIYIQSDEAMHEKDHPLIRKAMQDCLGDLSVEGFLFRYYHFWGDFWHYHDSYAWYPREIRIIRNLPEIHSWRDAQSFRYYHSFNYSAEDYRSKDHSRKLNVLELNASIYHYGGSRPPAIMTHKRKGRVSVNFGSDSRKSGKMLKGLGEKYDYGPLDRLRVFTGDHPAVMKEWIAGFNWKEDLQYSGKINPTRKKFKHERLKYRLFTPISKIPPFRDRMGFKNYRKTGEFRG